MTITEPARNGKRHRTTRVAPSNLQAEENLLGAMLLKREAIAEGVETCTADDFYRPVHGHIFDSMRSLYVRGEPADATIVADELGRTGLLETAGGLSALLSLQANTPATSNAGRYARIVAEHALLRRLIGVAGEIAEDAYTSADAEAAVDRAEKLIFELAQRKGPDTGAWLTDLMAEARTRLEDRRTQGNVITGVPTGFRDLDHKLLGLQPSNLVIVGARPSVGKTSFALGIAAHVAMVARTGVLFFSLEMSQPEITDRLWSMEARVDSVRIRNASLLESDEPKLAEAARRLSPALLHVDDNPNLTVMDMRAKARRVQSQLDGHLGLIVVDYIQLMTGRARAENRQVEVSEISRGLKVLAREMGMPVVALSQLSRNLEARADKRPILADLRESGSLEQDADVVAFLFRSDVYDDAPENRGLAEVIVAKNRNGPTGTVQLAFLDRYTRFADMAKSGF